jgi:hypothetical protein
MALDKATLKATIEATLNALKDYDGSSGKTQADAITKLATDLSNALDVYVKSGTVSTTVTVTSVTGVTPGVGVSGPGTGTGTGTIS